MELVRSLPLQGRHPENMSYKTRHWYLLFHLGTCVALDTLASLEEE